VVWLEVAIPREFNEWRRKVRAALEPRICGSAFDA
jgi:hypothetical protein